MKLYKRSYLLSGTGLPFKIEIYLRADDFLADVLPCGSNQPIQTFTGLSASSLMTKARRWLLEKR